MEKDWRTPLRNILLVVFVGSMILFCYHSLQSKTGENIYDEAERLANSSGGTETSSGDSADVDIAEDGWKEVPVEGDPYMEELAQTNLAALREVNPEVLGWISIPGTNVSYPIVQRDDNEYYLKHTWNHKSSYVGSIFMEHQNASDFSDYHTIIYGHNMIDDAMFGSLRKYKEADYLEAHPYIYIFDDRGCHRYEIFAVYEAEVKSNTYRLGFSGNDAKVKFLNSCLKQSVIDTEIIPTINDRIITLSTCTNRGYDTRWVVQARLRGTK